MKKKRMNSCLSISLLCVLLSWLPLFSAQEDKVISIRLSYKIILDPKNGLRPRDRSNQPITDQIIKEAIAHMNALFSSYWRGYRFELVEIKEVGNRKGTLSNPGDWFAYDFARGRKRDEVSRNLEITARKNASAYQWNDGALNLYIKPGDERRKVE